MKISQWKRIKLLILASMMLMFLPNAHGEESKKDIISKFEIRNHLDVSVAVGIFDTNTKTFLYSFDDKTPPLIVAPDSTIIINLTVDHKYAIAVIAPEIGELGQLFLRITMEDYLKNEANNEWVVLEIGLPENPKIPL
jgi:hypothetical protein